MILGGMPGIDKDGREIVTLILKTREKNQKWYNLKEGIDLDKNQNIKIKMLKSDLIPMNVYNKSNERWLYTKTLRHEATEISNREKNLQTELQIKQNRMLLLEAEIIRLSEQLKLARLAPGEFIKQGTEVFQESAKVLAELQKKEEK